MDYIVVEEAVAVGKDLHCEDLHNLWSHNDLVCLLLAAEVAEVPWQ